MKPAGTDFQLRVWEALLKIPYGKTMTYGALAEKLGCKLHIYEDLGHALYEEADDFNHRVLNFFLSEE